MATYIIGDLHGCFTEFQQLLAQANFDPAHDELWLTGDLIARGEDSLACLRFVKNLGSKATTVLGNHDLHFLATALGIKKVKPKDNVDAILTAPDRDELIDWLRHQPLLAQHPKHHFVLTHAGISPDWDLATAKQCAADVEQVLRADHYGELLAQMYDNQPDRWSPDLQGIERLRYTINVFTRMRFCFPDKRLDFDCKLPPSEVDNDLKPWFELSNPLFADQDILFGHWASLIGYPTPSHIYALDTGCVWGNHLTMIRWEDKAIFTEPAHNSH
ncbi:bis(5'-nucleosyl)-tetraphosphatase (symmetrical) [Pasteurellaceae bacterium Orientalotternb1]|nr:bis(5'-nucleosyl)-tetraphosphatase (symmetrical) [Pasteurellaceae bacterium Orientalotternb1]